MSLDGARDTEWAQWTAPVGYPVQGIAQAGLLFDASLGGVLANTAKRGRPALEDDLDHSLYLKQQLDQVTKEAGQTLAVLGIADPTDTSLANVFRFKVTELARTRDSHTLAVGDALGRIKLFDSPVVSAGPLCRVATGHSSLISNLHFSADDKTLFSTSQGDDHVRGAVFQWRHVTSEEAQATRNRVQAHASGGANHARLLRGSVRSSLLRQARLLDSVSDLDSEASSQPSSPERPSQVRPRAKANSRPQSAVARGRIQRSRGSDTASVSSVRSSAGGRRTPYGLSPSPSLSSLRRPATAKRKVGKAGGAKSRSKSKASESRGKQEERIRRMMETLDRLKLEEKSLAPVGSDELQPDGQSV